MLLEGKVMEHLIAIENVCAWPNLTLLPDGTIIATIFNQPCHGSWEGDVACWGSTDGGFTWGYRSTPAPHEPGTNRMNVAAGLTGSGALVVLASGWSNRPKQGEPAIPFSQSAVLKAWICRSEDGGFTWEIDKHSFPNEVEEGATHLIPFGDIIEAEEGTLGVSCYCEHKVGANAGENSAWFLVSEDDGRTWTILSPISRVNHNETTLLYLGGNRWIAASRTQREARLDQFSSADGGHSWRLEQAITLPSQHPGHLLRLQDRRVLLTYGVRCRNQFGVDVRVSSDEGKTWSAPARLVNYGDVDSGYPSTVQTTDGSLVTAYYAAAEPACDHYHMGVVIWKCDELFR